MAVHRCHFEGFAGCRARSSKYSELPGRPPGREPTDSTGLTTFGRPAPAGRDVVKTFRGRGDGVLVGRRTLEDEARRYWTTTPAGFHSRDHGLAYRAPRTQRLPVSPPSSRRIGLFGP